ncbi:MAG: hypothetical protein WCJ42_07640 [Actinomycetes bacterium]
MIAPDPSNSLDLLRTEAGLTVHDVMDGGHDNKGLHDLQGLLVKHFPDHAHVVGELDDAWLNGSPDPEVLIHGWLLTNVSGPVGFLVFHTNLRRGVMLQHYVAMEQSAREGLPFGWLRHLFDAMLEAGEAEASARGVDLVGAMGENSPHHVAGWRRIGYRVLDVDYREPYHGKHWADFGEPTFFDMTPMLKLTQHGAGRPLGEAAVAAASAYLIDHYLLDANNATVARTLRLAAALTY